MRRGPMGGEWSLQEVPPHEAWADGRGMEAGNMKPKHRLADGHLTLWLVELINSATNEKINWLGVKRAQTILYALHHSGFHIYPKDDKHEARAIRWLRAKGYVIGKRIE